MKTLAHELEDLAARRAAGTISDEDAALARQALLGRMSGTSDSAPRGRRGTSPRRGPVGWLMAAVLANLLLTLVILCGLAAMAYVLLPLALALPLLILMIFILPLLWLIEWIGDLF